MTEPEWLRPLAIATFREALSDMMRPKRWRGVIEWCEGGGQIGHSDWYVSEVLGVTAERLVEVAMEMREVKEIPPTKDWLSKVFKEMR